MKKLVWLDGEEVVAVDHSAMLVEETATELRVMATGDDYQTLKQRAKGASTHYRHMHVYQAAESVQGRSFGWCLTATYERGSQTFKARAARA